MSIEAAKEHMSRGNSILETAKQEYEQGLKDLEEKLKAEREHAWDQYRLAKSVCTCPDEETVKSYDYDHHNNVSWTVLHCGICNKYKGKY